mgnify:CR=1 FL=1
MDYQDGKIVPIDIRKEMSKSYLSYAMSVIVGRALPDVRDGLKPVHRRILYGMNESGTTSDKPYKKSARIVGDVMGRYHPHGDAAIYDAMVRMAQDFSYRYPLVDGHGNFGSIDGDSAAAMRYTEVRLSKIAMEMLADIHKETVDFNPNFDESLEEPSVLPARIPNLLVNGSSGIAVGMATNIPPHNLGEVIDGVVTLIDAEGEVSLEDLMTKVTGPDFPTGASILGREGIRSAYATGRGQIKVRASAGIEKMENGKSQIIVSEIPYMVNKAHLVEKIAELAREKRVDGITDLRDESDRNGMRIVVELRRDVNPNVVLNQLYKHTQLQENFNVIMLALVDGQPRVLNLKEVLYYYLEHQKDVVIRRTKFDLNKAEARAHILEGLKIALDNLDEVIKTIREAKNAETARNNLMSRFGLSEKQAQAILDLRLQRLTALEREKIQEEYLEIIKLIEYLRSLLADERKILNVIKEELLAIKDKYKGGRKTRIVQGEDDLKIEDLIADEDIVITLTHQGYIKRLSVNTYKSQRRGGRGVTGMHTKEEDFVEHLYITTTHNNILFLTNKGKMYRLKGHEIPEAGRQAKGTAIINLLELDNDEKITTIIPVRQFCPDKFLFMATKHGIVKKTPLSDYSNARKGGLIAIKLDQDDELIGVKLTDGSKEIIIGTRNGLAIRFLETDVRAMGRGAHGVKGVSLGARDIVVSMETYVEGSDLLVVTSQGFGKRTPLSEYKTQSRGGKGVKTINLKKRDDHVASLKVVNENNELMIVTKEGIIIRMAVEDISIYSRDTQGVRIMKLDENDMVISMAKLIKNKTDK